MRWGGVAREVARLGELRNVIAVVQITSEKSEILHRSHRTFHCTENIPETMQRSCKETEKNIRNYKERVLSMVLINVCNFNILFTKALR